MLPRIEKNIRRIQDQRIVGNASYQMDYRNRLAADNKGYRGMGYDVT